jgi:hypothetical protein
MSLPTTNSNNNNNNGDNKDSIIMIPVDLKDLHTTRDEEAPA